MVEWATIHAASTALVIGPMVLAALCTALRTLIVFGWWPSNDRLNSPGLAQVFDHAAIMGLIIGLISIPVVVLTGTLSSPHGGMARPRPYRRLSSLVSCWVQHLVGCTDESAQWMRSGHQGLHPLCSAV